MRNIRSSKRKKTVKEGMGGEETNSISFVGITWFGYAVYAGWGELAFDSRSLECVLFLSFCEHWELVGVGKVGNVLDCFQGT